MYEAELERPMSHEAETLESVMEDHRITAKQLALWCDCHKSTIYRYISGEKNIPIALLRHLYERTQDARLAQLITGIVPTQIIVLIDIEQQPRGASIPVPPIDQLLPDSTATVKACADGVVEMGKILADGKVDERDRQSIAKFKSLAADCNRRLAQMVAALTNHERRAANGEAVSA